ncbi:hypothetical protein RIF29_15940 [Crotalaria pallida]|uniref:Uncharacterized protein n=1 Tax=Crotalaria pallida TaxID=3830 RepID=A0AAN9IJG3_CROPI
MMVIADFDKYGIEENYYLVRQELIMEMGANRELYVSILGQHSYDVTRLALHAPIGSVQKEKWLFFPDMGHVIANKYDVALVTIGGTNSLEGGCTIACIVSGMDTQCKLCSTFMV